MAADDDPELTLYWAEHTNRGAELYISVKTVEFHLGHIDDKPGIRSRKNLIARTGARQPHLDDHQVEN